MSDVADKPKSGGRIERPAGLFRHPWHATEADVRARWAGRPGNFRCAWCGHRFAVGDLVRCVFTNANTPDCEGIGGNPFSCEACEAPRDEMLSALRAMRREAHERYWWFMGEVGQ